MNGKAISALEILENSIFTALETYSNVHRGSGIFSKASTRLYERAREIVLGYLGMDRRRFSVVFCSPRNADKLTSLLKNGTYKVVSDGETGLYFGVRAIAFRKKSLPLLIPFMTGGGTARLIAPEWIVPAKAPARYEPGTPAIINVIAFARALQLKGKNYKTIPGEFTQVETPVESILYGHPEQDLSQTSGSGRLKRLVTGREVMVPTADGVHRFINLDQAASTPALLPAWHAFQKAFKLPGAQHSALVAEVRNVVSRFLNAPLTEYEVVFCQNATEAVNIVAGSFSMVHSGETQPVVVNTLLEHNTNEIPWRDIPGVTIERIPFDNEGLFNFQSLDKILSRYNGAQPSGRKRVILVAANGGSNVLGTFNDLQETVRLTHQYGVPLLVDAAQLIAHRRVDMKNLDIDCLVFSGHKTYAPFGTGVLVVKKGILNYNALEMNKIHASGEGNPGGIAALGSALHLLQQTGLDQIQKEEQELTMRWLLKTAQIPGITIHGISDPESPHFGLRGGVLSFNLKGIMPNRTAEELANNGIGIRYGCHCAHLLVKHLNQTPPWAQTVQRIVVNLFPDMELPGVARISLGLGNTPEDIDESIRVLTQIAKGEKHQNHSPSSKGLPSKKSYNKRVEDYIRKVEKEVFGSFLQH
jgi:selenocysteine lyase/cysteine desulfurase